jgi:glyoxylase-like metal-dependent hydrolase (beta-lactamase superfamily II)/rhodanese-related sulfurtransferase
MKIEQIYTGCLAQGAYYIRSGNEAAVIDPLREVEPYIEKAQADGVKIKYVFETHFHADFVSGHIDLASKTGATIIYGPTANPRFDAHIAHDGEVFTIGRISITALHTPGHTMESVTYLLRDENGKEHAIFSGDTLFLGDVGRPDLAQKAAHLTKEELAGLLFDSLRSKIMTLPDDVIVYPAHGAGSACGKNMMKETVDTLGNQRKVNYALRANMTRDEFIKEVTDGLEAPPAYFPENVRLNKEGYQSFDKILKQGLRSLSPAEFEVLANEIGALILDTRDARSFGKGFIPNSINIGLDGSFAPWVGALIPGVEHPLLIVADPGREDEVVTRLARVGFENVYGFLNGGFESWMKEGREFDTVPSVSPSVLERKMKKSNVALIDVRKTGEYQAEHVETAVNIPLDVLNQHLSGIPKDQEVFIHCAGGYRSMIACSILRARGWDNIIDVDGGFKAIAQTSIPCTDYVCATTKNKK